MITILKCILSEGSNSELVEKSIRYAKEKNLFLKKTI